MLVPRGIGGGCFAAASWGTAFVVTTLLSLAVARQSLSATLQPIAHFGPNPGRLNMYVYVPDGHRPGSALVVALHGCVQKATDFDDETGLIAFADALKFVLLFPEQRRENNGKRCFNWFRSADNRKHEGESGSIRNMVQYVIDTYQVDPSGVFVLGLSAGGSMTAVLMANYPGLFQGGAIIAGTPYDCNKPSLLTWAWWWSLDTWFGDAAAASYACGLFNYAPTRRSPEAWGEFVRASSGDTPSRWPKVSLWQGGNDTIVNPANQMELVKQWTNVIGIDQVPDRVDVIDTIRHSVYRDASGTPRLETYEIAGFDHAIAVDPGTGPAQCGMVAPYVEDANICSSLKILKFWGVAP
jgi:poly(3-hydroxybutyrate) depolymerase